MRLVSVSIGRWQFGIRKHNTPMRLSLRKYHSSFFLYIGRFCFSLDNHGD